jgi:gas vesicle protein
MKERTMTRDTMHGERSDPATSLGWFLLGAVAGAAAALVLTPRTGRQTRELLAERADEVARLAQERAGELARTAQRLASEARGQTSEILDRSRDVLEQQAQRLKGAFEAGREAMREEMQQGEPLPRS